MLPWEVYKRRRLSITPVFVATSILEGTQEAGCKFLTGAHLSLASGNANRRPVVNDQPGAHPSPYLIPTPQFSQKGDGKLEMVPDLTASQEGLILSHLVWTKTEVYVDGPHRPILQ